MQQPATAGRPVYLIDGARTPFLKARGAPGPFRASDLAVAAGRPLLARQPFRPDALDEVILGCVAPDPDETNIGRVAALRLGCGERMPAWTVQRNCASGLQAIDSAAQTIASGRSELVLAGGVEAMSHHPVLLGPEMVAWLAAWNQAEGVAARGRQLARLRPAHFRIVVGLLRGLTDPIVGWSMGQTAEQIAWRFGITREMMDEFAMESHRRLHEAIESGWMGEIEPLFAPDGRLYERDDGLRTDTDMARLARLRPVFDRPVGRVTAGNSAQVTDGGAWVVLASAEAVTQHDLTPRARIVDAAWAALDPAQMGLGPAFAMAELLRRHALSPDDIDLWEINEAFAGQVLACLAAWQDPTFCRDELGRDAPLGPIPRDRLNIDGGAIAIGHPVGASGTRIVYHLLQALERTHRRRGIASLCIGGGQGGAILIEREGEL